MTKKEWDNLKEGDSIISKDDESYVFEWEVEGYGNTLCIATLDCTAKPLSELDPNDWEIFTSDMIDPNDRSRRMPLRSWVISPVSEGSMERRKGYELILQVQDDPTFIEFFKSNHDMWQRIYDLEDEAYANLNRSKMGVIR